MTPFMLPPLISSGFISCKQELISCDYFIHPSKKLISVNQPPWSRSICTFDVCCLGSHSLCKRKHQTKNSTELGMWINDRLTTWGNETAGFQAGAGEVGVMKWHISRKCQHSFEVSIVVAGMTIRKRLESWWLIYSDAVTMPCESNSGLESN